MNFINIRNLIDNIQEFDKKKDEDDIEEGEKDKYNAVISKSLDDITNLFVLYLNLYLYF